MPEQYTSKKLNGSTPHHASNASNVVDLAAVERRVDEHFERLGWRPTPEQREAHLRTLLPEAPFKSITPWRWRRHLLGRGVGWKHPRLFVVLIAVAEFMGSKGAKMGNSFPTQEQLVKFTKASRRTIQRHLEKAEKLGWIRRELAGHSGQAWRHSKYYACIPAQIETPVDEPDFDPPDLDDREPSF